MRIFSLFIVSIVLIGCASSEVKQPTTISSKIIADVGADEFKLDRSQDSWLLDYCKKTIEETSLIPTVYQRERGPRHVFEPMDVSDRFGNVDSIETCNYDYYFWPVTKQVYENLDLEYGYYQAKWDELHQTMGEAISQQLLDRGWSEVAVNEEADSKKIADFSFSRVNDYEDIREYLDLYFTKDEELVYELVVVVE